jgi:cytochrome c2
MEISFKEVEYLQNNVQVFMYIYKGCHTMDPNSAGRNSTGPALGLIFNRIAGSDAYFNGYTKALLKS